MVIHANGVSFIIGRYPKAKENYKNSNISTCKNVVFKKSSKKNQNPSRYYNNSIITNLKFSTQAKISSFKKKILI
jgi:hypothetical protein